MSPATVFAIVSAFLFGINIGSFLNVVIWRLPRGGSIASPTWSYCPRCEHRLGALDLVPVLSYLALGRKCRYCHERISWRYPAIELLTAVLFMAVAWRFGWTFDTIFYCLFVAVLVCVFFIDLEHFIIPDELNVTAGFLGFAHNGVSIFYPRFGQPAQFVALAGTHVPASIVGFVGYAMPLYVIGLLSYVVLVRGKNRFAAAWEYIRDNVLDWVQITLYTVGAVIPPLRKLVEVPEPLEGFTAAEIEEDDEAGGMGSGDGKLAAAIGANLFLAMALQSFLLAVFIGAFGGLIVMAVQRRRIGRTAIPFGPAMVAGAIIVLLFSNNLLQAWHWWVLTAGGTPGAPAPSGMSAPTHGF